MQAMLNDEQTPKTSVYRGGLAGQKAFTVAEITLLTECIDEIRFKGGDMWIKRHMEWPEHGLNSLKKKFMKFKAKDRRLDTGPSEEEDNDAAEFADPHDCNKNVTCPSKLVPYNDWHWELNVGNGKGKESVSPGNKSLLGNMPLSPSQNGFPNVQNIAQFPQMCLPPNWLPPIQNLVSFVPEAGPSTVQNVWALTPVLHMPAVDEPTNRLPGMDQFFCGATSLAHNNTLMIFSKSPFFIPLLIVLLANLSTSLWGEEPELWHHPNCSPSDGHQYHPGCAPLHYVIFFTAVAKQHNDAGTASTHTSALDDKEMHMSNSVMAVPQ
ncbi:hypothetical protein EI94DRAFT_1708244 [Lactarius quietus]|nr:hypothetical protein EI94DRAFT_1708244 [Lactarius quietus]